MSKRRMFRISFGGDVELSPSAFFGDGPEEAEGLRLKDGLEGLDINELLFGWGLGPDVQVVITDTAMEEAYELVGGTLWRKC